MSCKTFKWDKQSDESYEKTIEMSSFSVSTVWQFYSKKGTILVGLLHKFAMNRITDVLHVNRQNSTSHAGFLDGLRELLICFMLPLNSYNKHS